MKRLIYTFNWFYLFGLSLWVGGMFLLGILVEAMVRIKLKAHPELASMIMGGIMDVFNVHIIYTCIVFMVLAEGIKYLAAKKPSSGYYRPAVTKRRYSREVMLAIMVVLAIYMGSFLRPEMHAVDKLKKANPENTQLQVQFSRFHTRFELIYSINMILGLSLLYIHGKEMARFRDERQDPGSN